jgi:hypothetical protein
MNTITRWLVQVGAVLLAACGGGGGGNPVDVADAVPASAFESPEAFTRYVAALPDDDRREPLTFDRLEAPTSETAEPLALAR